MKLTVVLNFTNMWLSLELSHQSTLMHCSWCESWLLTASLHEKLVISYYQEQQLVQQWHFTAIWDRNFFFILQKDCI